MDINLAVPWKQRMSRGKHYLSKNLLRCVENLFCIDRKHHTLSVFKIIFHLQFQNLDIVLLKTNAYSLVKYTKKQQSTCVQYWFVFRSSTWQCLLMTSTLRCLSSSCSTCLSVLTPIVLLLTGSREELYSPISSSHVTTVE